MAKPKQFIHQIEFQKEIMILTINDIKHKIYTIDDLEQVLKTIKVIENVEIWMAVSESQNVCALVNKKRVFLMLLDLEEDKSLIHFDNKGKKEKYEEFILSNGQKDEYQVNNTIDRLYLDEVIRYFYYKQKVDKYLKWDTGRVGSD